MTAPTRPQGGGRQPVPEPEQRHNKKRRELNHHRGIPNRLAPTQARQHLTLLRQTMAWDRIATESGCSAAYLRDIAAGRVPRINRVTHNKIMSVRPAATRDRGFYIDATGTVRRVRALMARGHSQYTIADAADTTQYRISLLSQGQARVRQKLADKIAHAYAALADTAGTSTRAVRIAAERNWRDPDYWTDTGRIDDPTHDPDVATSKTVALGEDAHELVCEQGHSWDHAVMRLGETKTNLQQAHRRWRLMQKETAA